MANDFVCVGIITSPHGVKGYVKIKIFAKDITQFVSYGTLTDKVDTYVINVISIVSDDIIIVQIQNITSRSEAEKLRNKHLYIKKTKLLPLNKDEFYHAELIGLKVLFKNKVEYGFIKAVHNFGSCDIIELSLLNKKSSVMLPFTEDIFPDINIKEGYLIVSLPEIIGSK
ncbi:ribosome maturation factor RimM [Candidatus Neoehrlichia procyonis]|uniref:Ribosome maturation factor RimM n=1 Tax=Candidatus Neoehrlichia procyonis str. RAC413 TaxID=1359163 RepID=A0A0F3NNP0_9RICK|nr:ribosome maturation factor RimM [Candidatus Neoehrlichia lotoris]KJV69381.1 16S rRNA processing protein RimM [Candidatus Neoehrlichia lotoris str. RAC413]